MSFKATCVGCHMRRVHVSLAVTCHLHSWQKDWDLLCAIAVTWGWNRYPSKSQCRKLTLEKKTLPLLLLGLKPMTFQSPVWNSTTDLFLSAAMLYCVDWWNTQWSQFDSSIQVNIIWLQLISLVTNALSIRRIHKGHCFYIDYYLYAARARARGETSSLWNAVDAELLSNSPQVLHFWALLSWLINKHTDVQ